MASTDWGRLLSFKKQAYIGIAFVNAVAAQVSAIQLYNPAASGVLLLVRGTVFNSNLADTISYGFTTTDLAVASGQGGNKYANGPAPKALLRGTTAAAFTFAGGYQFGAVQIAANGSLPAPFSEPLIIPAGVGIIAFGAIVNEHLFTDFEWDEVNG